MDLKDLKKMSSFPEINEINKERLTVHRVLINFRFFGTRIIKFYESYCNTEDEFQKDCYLTAVKSTVNDYVQCFIDIVPVLAVINKEENAYPFDSLSSVLRYFVSTYGSISPDTKGWLEFLQNRNKLEHEYYNFEYLNHEMKIALYNYSKGVMELIDFCENILKSHNYLEYRIRRK